MLTHPAPPPELNAQTWVCITFGQETRRLFWYKVGVDGSIYICLTDKPDYVVHGRAENGAGVFGEPVVARDLRRQKSMNIAKISFHPSGKMHQDFSRRTMHTNFWDVQDRRLLLAIIFRDTHKLPLVP